MGQQQLLLVILGVIVVGIAVAVGISMFTGLAADANRDRVVNDLVNLSARAQQYMRRPVSSAGGGNDFGGFYLTQLDTGNPNGSYSVSNTLPSGKTFVPGSIAPISGSGVDSIFIVGCGKELGDDQVNFMKVYVVVSRDNFRVSKLN